MADALPAPGIRFYTRPGCHLCNVARETLLQTIGRREVRVEYLNVEDDPGLEARWGRDVPVVEIHSEGGTRVFRHHLDPDTLESELEDLWNT
jgi:hypothetical protein